MFEAPRVLAGLRCLRLGSSLAGDFLCAILADAGATIDGHGPAIQATGEARVIINDLGRGAAAPAGLDFAALEAAGRDVIYCALVSFPENGPRGLPELQDDPILAVLGLNRANGGEPVPEPLRVPSLYGAQMAAIYIACALLPRNAAPGARYIEVPLAAIALNVLGRLLVRFDDACLTDPLTVHHLLPISVPRKCADGAYIQPHGMFPHFVRILFQVAGHPEWAEEAARGLFNLPDAASVAMWNQRMDEMFHKRPASEWEQVINAARGACTRCRTYEEWLAEDHPNQSGIFAKGTPANRVGAGFTIRAALRRGPARADPAFDATRPLYGVRVVDFCIIIAGPTVGRILADLGADVVKIDAPNRVPNPYLWMDTNRGKRSLVLDLRRAEARDIAVALAARADVLIENFRKDKLARFGLGHDDVATVNPDVIYASTNAFDQDGPWAGRAGWEHNAQAATGMQWGRARDGVPRHVPVPVNDYATGLFGALGIVLALLWREWGGGGARVTASLARSATFLQRAHYVGEAAVPARHTIACADGWVSVYPRPGQDRAALPVASECPAATTLANLLADGCDAVIESSPAEFGVQPWLGESGLRVHWEHPAFGPMSQTVCAGTMRGLTLSPRHPAPAPGADNRAVLAEIGLASRLDDLVACGAVGSFPLFANLGSEACKLTR